MIVYKVQHKYKLNNHYERKHIGEYSSLEFALGEIEKLKLKVGFCDTKNCFKIRKVFRFTKPRLIDKTFWIDGYDTYTYTK